MKLQRGYVNIPTWYFVMVPVGLILCVIEGIRIVMWLYEHVEFAWK